MYKIPLKLWTENLRKYKKSCMCSSLLYNENNSNIRMILGWIPQDGKLNLGSKMNTEETISVMSINCKTADAAVLVITYTFCKRKTFAWIFGLKIHNWLAKGSTL